MASVSPPSPSCSTIRTPVRRSPPRAFAVSELRRLKQRRTVLPPVAVGLSRVADVVRSDVEFLKNKIGIGIKWANVAFRVPEVTKSAEEVFWLRHLEDSASPPLEQPSLPQPSYSGFGFKVEERNIRFLIRYKKLGLALGYSVWFGSFYFGYGV